MAAALRLVVDSEGCTDHPGERLRCSRPSQCSLRDIGEALDDRFWRHARICQWTSESLKQFVERRGSLCGRIFLGS